MTAPVLWGAVLGGVAGAGAVTALARLARLRRTPLEVRVLPYVRDLPQASAPPPAARKRTAFAAVFGLPLRSAADRLERVVGGAGSVRRRLDRANLPLTVQEFRVQQVTWGLVAFGGCGAVSLLAAVHAPARALPLLVLCAVAFVLGVLARDNRLSAQVTQRERQVLAEFPSVAELLALSVAAGEGPTAALDRIVTRANGALAEDLGRVLAEVRTGEPLTRALDGLASRSGLPVVSRFAEGMAVAVERGTPLADVLHAQAADVREAGRRRLIEAGARKEIAMMVPVVFLILPVTVLFAFWPGLVGLRLVTP
ncbi:MAG TPA: type II secretion system F family protein [Nocardioidaceae bacterium]|nr:type II secretion system F family protein [Nocardioidaceae bacterium]